MRGIAQAGRGDGGDPARQARAAGGTPADAGRKDARRDGRGGDRRHSDPQRRGATGGEEWRPGSGRAARRRARAPRPRSRCSAWRPRCWLCEAAISPPTTAWSTSRSRATRRTPRRPTPPRSTIAAALISWPRCSPPPLSATSPHGAPACAAPPPRPPSGWAAPLWPWRSSPGVSASRLARSRACCAAPATRSSAWWARASRPPSSSRWARPRSPRSFGSRPCRRPGSLDRRPYHSPMATEAGRRTRLDPGVFRLPVDESGRLVHGRLLQLHPQLLQESGRHPHVTMQVFQKQVSVLGGIDEAIAVLKLCSGDWERARGARAPRGRRDRARWRPS